MALLILRTTSAKILVQQIIKYVVQVFKKKAPRVVAKLKQQGNSGNLFGKYCPVWSKNMARVVKSCPENISSVVEVLHCFYLKKNATTTINAIIRTVTIRFF